MTRLMALGEVGSYFNGKAFKPSDWSAEGLPIIRIANLNNSSAPFNYFLGEVRAEQRVDDGDLLVSWSASLDAYIWNRGPAAVNQHIFKVYERPDVVDRTYLWYALRTAMGEVRAQVHGATMQHITKPEFERIQIPVPSVEVQRRIAAELASQAEEATKLRRSLEALQEAVRGLSEATRREFMQHLPSDRVPLGSIVGTPGAIIDGPFGSNLKTDHYQEGGVRVIRLGNIGIGRFIDIDRAFVTPAHADFLHRHRAEVGDVVVAALGDGVRPAGRACLVPPGLGPAIVKADCFRVRTSRSGLDAAFLVHVLNSPQTQAFIQAATRGATRPRMNLVMLKNLAVPIPAIDEQRRLAAQLDERLAMIGATDACIRAAQEALDALPAALLRRAFEDLAA